MNHQRLVPSLLVLALIALFAGAPAVAQESPEESSPTAERETDEAAEDEEEDDAAGPDAMEPEADEAEAVEPEADEVPAMPTAPTTTPDAETLQPAMRSGETPRAFAEYASEAGSTGAAPAGGTGSAAGVDWGGLTRETMLEPSQTFPSVEWHGSFRFRAESFYHLGLGTNGTSPHLPPLQSTVSPDRADGAFQGFPESAGDESLARFHDRGSTRTGGANMRFRLQPIFHVAEDLRLHLEVDVLDNVVLGTQPDRRFGHPTDQTSQSRTGLVEQDNLLVVRQAYGEVQTFLGTLTVGRQASHWGLGILDHGGGGWQSLREPRTSYRGVPLAGHTCLDCDYATTLDRVQFRMNLFDTYLAVSWDYNDAGLSNAVLGDATAFGQPRFLGRTDNTRSLTLQAFRRPLAPTEIAARNRTLKELRQPAFDWGLYVQHRRQTLQALGPMPEDGWMATGMSLWIPDLWLRFTHEPAFRRRIRLEVEAVAVLGSIDNVNEDVRTGGDDASELTSRDVRQFGAAAEFEMQTNALTWGLNSGLATGRDTDAPGGTYFGAHDGPIDPVGENSLTAFHFHPNYFVDMLMFREIIGTVTNAVYANPFLAYDFFSTQEDVFGLRTDLMFAFAMDSSTTPSGEGFYGVEADLQLYYREPRYGADLTFGLFFPGSAFNAVPGRQRMQSWRDNLGASPTFVDNRSARPAAAMQARLFWAF
ncbi:MAG: hypothetical protein EA398_01075 [Deltaproteobacteria bacterium]|nr:MAG: hypothetical protein EA398_01075 [Deltaproteobacteria bacterium]